MRSFSWGQSVLSLGCYYTWTCWGTSRKCAGTEARRISTSVWVGRQLAWRRQQPSGECHSTWRAGCSGLERKRTGLRLGNPQVLQTQQQNWTTFLRPLPRLSLRTFLHRRNRHRSDLLHQTVALAQQVRSLCLPAYLLTLDLLLIRPVEIPQGSESVYLAYFFWLFVVSGSW